MSPRIGLTMSVVTLEEGGVVRKHAMNDAYVLCVLDAGGLPSLLPNVPIGRVEDAVPRYLDGLDGLLLTGGDDVRPERYGQAPLPQLEETDDRRDAFEIALTREAHRRGVPVLAICRGVQVANVALGGSLLQDIPAQVVGALRHRRDPGGRVPEHRVRIAEGCRLRVIAGADEVVVNSYHHQAVDRAAPGLIVTARAGDGVVEGLEDPSRPFFLGVQWHPERSPEDPLTRALFGAFLDAARAPRGTRSPGAPVRAG